MATQMGVTAPAPVDVTAERVQIGDLADIMSRTLPECGMDRMTGKQVEELLAVSALTAHL